MTRLTLAAAIGLAFASAAWGQAPPPGTYTFVSGPGVGTPPFTVTGFSTSLGGSIGNAHLPNCGGLHVHGTFNGIPDPNSGGCGHGIISLVQSVIPGSSSLLPGSMPSSAAGMLALTGYSQFKTVENESPRPTDRIYTAYDYFDDVRSDSRASDVFRSNFFLTGMDPVQGTTVKVDRLAGLFDTTIGRQFFGEEGELIAYYGPRSNLGLETSAIDAARFDWSGDVGTTLFGTPNPTPQQLRDGPPKPPAAPGASPPAPATPGSPGGSILDDIREPTLREVFGGTEPAPKPQPSAADVEKEKFLDKAAQDIADGLFSGNADKGKAAAAALGNAPRELQNRVVKQINERVQKIVNDAMRASTSRAAQPGNLNSAQMHAADVRIRWDTRP